SSGEESDGQTALRKVQEQDVTKSRKRGPVNESIKHWHGPVPIRDRKNGDRWQFTCRYCSAYVSLRCPLFCITDGAAFEDEPRKPSLANLASHLKEDHPAVLKGESPPEDGKASVDHGYTLGSAKLMAAYIKEGVLNPALEPTKKGFHRVFAAWILDDNLPFTAGESPSLARVFKYLKVNFMLPSDTTRAHLVHGCLTMDNASANDVLARTLVQLLLKRYGLHFNCENARIRCIAHVVNLVVQKILSELAEADDPALADYYELWNKHLPFHYDPESDEENEQLDTEKAMDGDGADSAPESCSESDNDELNDDLDLDILDGSQGQTALKKV
ncbi:hypothetical protein C2E23DRAFT_724823, partial [Lenzites betulinus]